jgi:hypothetical protein
MAVVNLLLLHYSPSSSYQAGSYPSLFLGGWEHVFLDSVGCDTASLDVDRHISIACNDETSSKTTYEENAREIRELLVSLLPRVLPRLACQRLFYHQPVSDSSFKHRQSELESLLLVIVGESTIRDILCEKFSILWLESAVRQATRQAAEALMSGTTQVSLSMSVHSFLLHLFESFLGNVLCLSNQWKNMDLVKEPCSALRGLFAMILRGLPVPPCEEIILQRNQLGLFPLPQYCRNRRPQFPFFHFVSSFLDELVESVHDALIRRTIDSDDNFSLVSSALCFENAMGDLQSDEWRNIDGFKSNAAERLKLVRAVVAYVVDHYQASSDVSSLFDRYLHQYIEWKIGCSATEAILPWWTIRIRECGANCLGNILSIHVTARLNEMEAIRIASVLALVESFPSTQNTESTEGITSCHDLCNFLLESVERHNHLRSIIPWPVVLSIVGEPRSLTSSDRVKQLRKLSFAHLLYPPNGEIDGSEQRIKMKLLSENDYAVTRYIERVRVDLNNRHAMNDLQLLLQHFLSPVWLQTTTLFRTDDLNSLVNCISEGMERNRRWTVSLLRSATRGIQPLIFGVFSLEALGQISGHISADNVSLFSNGGTRESIPHFIPKWLRRGDSMRAIESTDSAGAYAVFFSRCQHSFDGELSEVVFELFLSTFAAEAESLTSEQIFLILSREMESEISLDQRAHAKLSRLRAVGSEQVSLRGSGLAAIALSARVVSWVAKVAFEFATSMVSSVFSGVYAGEAMVFLDTLMLLQEASWQHFFVGTILRIRGEGALSAALTGPLSAMRWTHSWSQGIPTNQERATEILVQAELFWLKLQMRSIGNPSTRGTVQTATTLFWSLK